MVVQTRSEGQASHRRLQRRRRRRRMISTVAFCSQQRPGPVICELRNVPLCPLSPCPLSPCPSRCCGRDVNFLLFCPLVVMCSSNNQQQLTGLSPPPRPFTSVEKQERVSQLHSLYLRCTSLLLSFSPSLLLSFSPGLHTHSESCGCVFLARRGVVIQTDLCFSSEVIVNNQP